MLTLLQLEARFLMCIDGGKLLHYVDTLGEADGVQFLCPKCFEASGRTGVGVHGVICWFRGKVADDVLPGPGRWNPGGTGLKDLTFIPPGAISIQLKSGCCWHGHVRAGEATLS